MLKELKPKTEKHKRTTLNLSHEKLFKPYEITEDLKEKFVKLNCAGDFCDIQL